jgi:hypothetical protein
MKLAARIDDMGMNPWPQLMSASAYATPITTSTAWIVEFTLQRKQRIAT